MILKKKKFQKELKGLKITKSAIKQIYFLIQKNKNFSGIKINIKKSGCAGYKYDLKLSNYKEKDNIYIIKKIKFFISKKWSHFLEYTKIDFVKNGLNYNFVFNNPNNSYMCGCGESFDIKIISNKI